MRGITKTIPKGTGTDFVDSLYDGRLSEYEFHMAGTPSKLVEGDYVYTIYENELIGRIKVEKLVFGATNPKSGKPRTLIVVGTPGERLASPIPMQGHRGTRYYDGSDWPG